MGIKITHPEGATGSFSGITFEEGVAELPSLSDEARAVLSEHGYTFDGQNEAPTEAAPDVIVGDVVPEGTVITPENAAVVEHSDGTVEVGTLTEQAVTAEDIEKVGALGKTLPEAAAAPGSAPEVKKRRGIFK